MSTITSKVQWAAAAFAVVAVATLTPVAFAAPGDDTSSDTTGGAVGTSAGEAPTRSNRTNRPRPNDPPASDTQTGSGGTNTGGTTPGSTPSTGGTTPSTGGTTPDRASTDVTAPTAPATTPGTNAVGANPLFQNPLIWIGQPNPNPPPSTPIYTFEPLGNLPQFARPMYGWMEGFNFEGCVLGIGTTINGQTLVGPYGTSTSGVSTSGCA